MKIIFLEIIDLKTKKNKMLRRAARERREFIYKKTVEQRQKAIEDKRERLKSALEGISLK